MKQQVYQYTIEDYSGKTNITQKRPLVFRLELHPDWRNFGVTPFATVVELSGGVYISGGIWTKIIHEEEGVNIYETSPLRNY